MVRVGFPEVAARTRRAKRWRSQPWPANNVMQIKAQYSGTTYRISALITTEENSVLKHKLMTISTKHGILCNRPVIYQDFSWFAIYLCLKTFLKELREVASYQGKKEVACIVSTPLESVRPPKLKIQEVQGTFSSRPKRDAGQLSIFQDFLL